MIDLSAYRPRILVPTRLDKAGLERLAEVARVEVQEDLPPQELAKLVRNFEGLIIDNNIPIPDAALEAGEKLRVIGVLGESPRMNLDLAKECGIEVVFVAPPSGVALAEQTMALMLSLAHKHRCTGLSGKTLGIVGLGEVGRGVAARARAFGMKVLIHLAREAGERWRDPGFVYRELEPLLAASDFISLHLSDRPDTRHLIGAREIALCRPTAFLINMGGLEIIDPAALLAALDKGGLAGVALAIQEGAEIPFPAEWHPRLHVVRKDKAIWDGARRQTAIRLADEVIAQLRTRHPGELPMLRVVPLERVLPHEDVDPHRVESLKSRLKNAETLVNPPVVTEVGGHYIVLDGATRVTAMKSLGFPHIVVQIIQRDDSGLAIGTWHHAVRGLSRKEFVDLLRGLSSVALIEMPMGELQEALDRKEGLCGVVTPEHECYLARAAEGVEAIAALNDLVLAYTAAGIVTRTVSDDFDTLETEVPGVAALVCFPQFTFDEIIKAALDGRLIPHGITRSAISGRALRLHADLERLRADEPLDSKNRWLARLLAEKFAARSVRYYQEPVILMDE